MTALDGGGRHGVAPRGRTESGACKADVRERARVRDDARQPLVERLPPRLQIVLLVIVEATCESCLPPMFSLMTYVVQISI